MRSPAQTAQPTSQNNQEPSLLASPPRQRTTVALHVLWSSVCMYWLAGWMDGWMDGCMSVCIFSACLFRLLASCGLLWPKTQRQLRLVILGTAFHQRLAGAVVAVLVHCKGLALFAVYSISSPSHAVRPALRRGPRAVPTCGCCKLTQLLFGRMLPDPLTTPSTDNVVLSEGEGVVGHVLKRAFKHLFHRGGLV